MEFVGVSFDFSEAQPERQVIRPERSFSNPPPELVTGNPPTPVPAGYSAHEEFLVRLDGGYLSKRVGVADRSGRRLQGVSCLTPHQLEELESFRAPFRRAHCRKLPGATLALSTGQESNYFHWLFEVIGRYGLAEASGEHFDQVYVECRHPFQRASLAALGVPEAMVIRSDEHPVVQCDSILAPCCLEAFWSPTDWMVEYLRSKFWMGDPQPRRRRVYITRAGTNYRRTRNEGDVLALVEQYGFEPVALEEHDLATQAAIFRSAEVIVGTHGAGLANLAFATPGTWVIELMPPRYCHWVYYILAARAECKYICVMGEGETDPSQWGHQKEDIQIDIAKLDEALRVAGL